MEAFMTLNEIQEKYTAVNMEIIDLFGKMRKVTLPISYFNENILTQGIGFDASNFGYADVNPSFVQGNIIHPVWRNLPEFFISKVVGVYPLRLALNFPFPPAILIVSDEFLLFRVDRNCWKTRTQKR